MFIEMFWIHIERLIWHFFNNGNSVHYYVQLYTFIARKKNVDYK